MFNEEQLKAINIRNTNTLVSAGAGSGKTTVLSERVISLMKEGYDLSRILILTFTNNAAANMKVKIYKKILDEESLLDEAKKVAGADIMTFDAFNHKLAKKYSYKLGLENGYSIIDETILSVVKREYLKDRFEEFIKEEKSEFIYLMNNYCKNNYGPLLDWLISSYDKIDIEVDPERIINERIDNPLFVNLNEIYKNIYEDGKRLFREFISEFDKGLSGYDTYLEYLKSVYEDLDNAPNYDAFATIIKKMRMKAFKTNGNEEDKELFDSLKKKYIAQIKVLCNIITQSSFEEIYSSNKNIYVFLYSLIKDLRNYIDEYKIDNRVFSFQDIAHKVLSLLRHDDEIRNELKEYYQEIMVDEYQDNSDLQEEMINLLDNNNLFLVGDIKQSIYRFRHANPKLFLNRYKDYKEGNKSGVVIDMNRNYRSSRAVIKDVNLIFKNIMSEKFGGADYDENQAMISANPMYEQTGYNDDLILIGDEKSNFDIDNEILAIANDIKRKIQDEKYDYKDFSVILDRSTNFDSIIRQFTTLGIPVAADYNGSIISLNFSLILINILKILKGFEMEETSSNEFKHAFTAISRSYLVEMNDNDIFKAIRFESYLSCEWLKNIKAIYDNLKGQSILKIYSSVLDYFNLFEKIIKGDNYKDDLNVLELFRSHIEQLENLHYDFASTVEYFNTLQDNELTPKGRFIGGKVNAVTLINIHMSKGLEYNHCYFPYLHKKYVEKGFQSALQYSEKYGLIFGVEDEKLNPNCINGSASPLLYTYSKEEKNESRQERIRLLYVALTRAKHSFTLVRKEDDNDQSYLDDCKSFDQVLSYSNIYSSVKQREVKENIDVISSNQSARSIDLGFKYHELNINKESKPTLTKSSKNVTSASFETLQFGTRMHEILESLDLKNPDLSNIKNSRYETAITNFLNQDFMKNIDKAEVYQEFAFIDKTNNTTGIIDLMLVYDDHVKIIDYKLKHIDDPEYIKQLSIYKTYIEQQTNKPVETYLYSIIDHTLVSI